MQTTNKSDSGQLLASQIPARQPDYVLEQLDNELLLYHPSDTRILYLNQTASLVWGLCDGKRSIGQIIDLLNQAYPEAAENIPADVHAALEQFLQAGCIRVNDASSA
jgi:hypothetical protein